MSLEGQVRARHRVDQRNRPGHRRGVRRRGLQRHAERLRRSPPRSQALRDDIARRSAASKVEYQRRRHEQAGRDRRSRGQDAATFGGVDILVNNAGIQHVAPIEKFPPEKWDAIIAINLSATFHAIHAPCRLMKAERLGPHRQHRQHARPRRLGAQGRLRRGQARHLGLDQGRRHRMRRHRRHLQRDLPRLRDRRRWRRTQIEATREGRQASASSRPSRPAVAEKQPQLQFTTTEQIAGTRRCSWPPIPRPTCRAPQLVLRRRLDRPIGRRPWSTPSS